MSQFDFGDLESPLSGTNLINSNLEPWRDALHSLHSGSSRPSYVVAGMQWMNNTTNPWVLNIFDGTDDISLGTINTSTNEFIPSGGVQLTGNNTWTGTNSFSNNATFQGDLIVNDVLAETTAGFNLKDSNGNICLSGGAGGAANLTMGGNMSGASTHKLTNMVDPTSAQDYTTKSYVDDAVADVTPTFVNSATASPVANTVIQIANPTGVMQPSAKVLFKAKTTSYGMFIGQIFNNDSFSFGNYYGATVWSDDTYFYVNFANLPALRTPNNANTLVTSTDFDVVVQYQPI